MLLLILFLALQLLLLFHPFHNQDNGIHTVDVLGCLDSACHQLQCALGLLFSSSLSHSQQQQR